jgi:RHS repeat-associated protein
VTITGAGTVVLKASLAASGNYTAGTLNASFTVNLPVSVSVSPATATLYGGQTVQLTATVANTSNTALTWSIAPAGVGTLSASGLYTAPATITAAQTVTVTASSQADPTRSASATVTLTPTQCGSSGYINRRVLTIHHSQVPNTDQTDYPMLVSGVYPFLATVANGGRVQNANGYDIVFTSDVAGQNPLDFEIDNYNGANGTAAFWVRIPSLSHTVDTTIYMWYGNPNISSTQENIAGVWRNNYLSVYHLGNGTSIGMADSGSAGYTLAQSGSVSPAAGVIGGGAAFNGDAGSYLYHDSVTAYPSGSTGQETLEAWEQFPTNGGGEVFGYGANWPNGSRIALGSSSTGPVLDFENIAIIDSVPINNAWHHLVGTYAGGGVTSTTSQLYLDGVPLPGNDNNEGNVNISTAELKIGGIPTVTFCCGSTGSLDEVRISSMVRSADWISTEFNNESSPSTFYQLSDENEVSVTPTSVILYSSQTQQFSANSCLGYLAWALSPARVGTLTTSGLYTAPASITAQQTVTVTVTDQANPASPASATITLDPPVAVNVSPATATLYGGQSQQFTATVLYTGNTTVIWTVSPAGAGTISTAGLFTATSSLATGQTVTITATSQSDPTKSASAIITLSPLPCPNTGYSFERRIAINHAMVPNTDQANFPVLISGTYPYLATVANGGQIQNANGYDVMFSSDAAGHNKLDYEIDSYNGTTGAVAYWVRVPVVSHTNDTALYMWYGNPSIATSQENRAGVWSNGYAGVWHFGTPESGIAADSTANGNNGINHEVLPAAGIFGSAGTFDGTGNTFLDIPSSTSYKPTSTLTLEAWVNMSGAETDNPDIFSLDSSGNGSGGEAYELLEWWIFGVPQAVINVNGASYSTLGGPRLQAGQWAHMVAAYDGQQLTIYENGIATSELYAPGVINYGNSKDLDIGTYSPYATPTGWSFAGLMDEARISTMARSADWIAAQYSNQSSPSTFYTISSVIPSAVNLQPSAVNLYALQSQQFEVVSACGAADAIWSVPAGSPGTLTEGGIYFAPESITSQATVTITATTLGISSTVATATVTLMPPVSVSVTPPSTVLTNGQTQQMTANVANTSHTAVNWTVSPGGVGSISATGLYSAPGNISAPQTVTITATSQWYPTELASATITLMPPVAVSVSPATATLYAGQTAQLTPTVINTGNTTVIWTISPAGVGTLSTTGLYTAPTPVLTQQMVTITATSQVDATKSAMATLTLAPVSINLTPTVATLSGGQKQQFTALVANSSNTAVIWTMRPAGTGTLSASGLYMAPATISAQQTVTITATSQADTTKSASATMTLIATECSSNGYSYRRALTINHSQVPNTDQQNYPLLFNTTDPLLASTANGGHVSNVNGYDVVFTIDGACTAKLNDEIEGWNAATGQLIAWVQIPGLSHTTDTTIYLCYGNSNITSDQSNKTGVWDSNYLSVLHLDEATGTTVFDSTANGNNGTKVSQSSLMSTPSGEIGGAQAFNGTSDFIALPPSMTGGLTVFSVSFWTNSTDMGNNGTYWNRPQFVGDSTYGGSSGDFGVTTNSGDLGMWSGLNGGGDNSLVSASYISDNTWHRIDAVNNGSSIELYLDGADTYQTLTSGLALDSYGWYLGAQNEQGGGAAFFHQGSIDEFRFSNSARSSDWISTEYHNQSSSSTFYQLSAENTVVNPPSATLYSSQSEQFTATPVSGCTVPVTWTISPSGTGTIDSTGFYTAPAGITMQQTVTISAISQVDSTTLGSATITLKPTVVVSVSPATASLYGGQTQQLTATVANSSNMAVTWTVNPVGMGTINTAGLYTAPATVTAQQTVSITATSQADSTQSASATVTLLPPAVTPIPPSTTQCGSSGYSSQSTIVIDRTKVQNTDQTDFPFMFNTTDPSLATTANGGQVTSSSGYDIIFSTDPNGLTKLDHELEGYNPLTGQVTAWVRIPTLSHTTDTVLYVFYGNQNITTSQQNPAGVWGANYQAVYHLSNVGTGVAADSSTYGNTATLTSVVPALGGIDGTASFNGVSSYIQAPTTVFPTMPTGAYDDIGVYSSTSTLTTPFAATFGAWFNTASAGVILGQGGQYCSWPFLWVCIAYSPTEPGVYDPDSWASMLYIDTNGSLNNGGGIVTSTAYNDSKWHFAVVTDAHDGTETLYVDGKDVGSERQVFRGGWSPYYEYYIGTGYTLLTQTGNWNWLYFNGDIDEVSITNNAQTADWIATEYNDQSSPSTFYKFSPQGTVLVVPSPVSLYASQSQQFAVVGTCSSGVNWTLQQGAPGTLSPTGLYTATTSLTTQQTVTVTASSQANGTAIGSAAVTLLPPPPPITLAAATQPPYVIGSTLTFVASLKDQTGTPEPGVTVTFAVNGANSSFGSATSDVNGNASYTYTGANIGNDTIQATAVVTGVPLASNSISASWIVPAGSNSAASITLAGEPALGLGGLIGAFTDNNGAVIEPIAIGASPISYVVPVGATQLQLGINDSYYSDNGGAGFTVSVNGSPLPIPILATTVPWTFVTGGLNNNYQFGIGTAFSPSGDGSSPVVVKGLTQGQSVSILYQSGTVSTNFPTQSPVNADGDQTNITGGKLLLGAYYPTLYTNASSYPIGQPITFDALVNNSNGAPLANIPVTLYVTGANPGQYQATTDSTGNAAFLYSGQYAGTDSLQAQAFPSGQASLVSGQASVTWTNYPTPPPVGSLGLTMFAYENDLQAYTVMATDASGNLEANADVGFYVSGVDNFQSNGVTDITGHVAFDYMHDESGSYSVVAVDSIGRNVTISTLINGIWSMSPTTGSCGNCNTINISVSVPGTITMPNKLPLSGTVTDNVGITPTVTWSLISGPGTVIFDNPHQATTTAVFSQFGIYVLQISASDSGVSATEQVTVTVYPAPIPASSTDWGGSPLYGATVSGVVPIILPPGVTLQSGTLTYFPVDNMNNVTVLNANTVSSSGPVIGTLDTTTMVNGSYWIELQATLANGNPQNDLVQVTVAGNYKPGRVTASVTDLIVPATGLAINIQRQYDSLNAGTSGDFGYGWNLGINTNLTTDASNNVTFTLGGQRKTFYFTPSIAPDYGFTIFDETWAAYTAEPGLAGTLTPQLDEANCPFGLMARDGSMWLCSTGSLYSPLGYTYTDASGTQYSINANGALQSITDIGGNSLTVTSAGITSSTGLSVPFVRDSSNRITQITDPAGNIYQYGYGSNGNLTSVTYPPTTQTSALCPNTTQPNTSTYTYDSNHLYTGGTDALCHVLPSTAYFPSGKVDANGNSLTGRLQSVTDALGETMSYAYNLATNTTTITYPPDANDNTGTAVMTYDSYGMLLSCTDPLGLITTNVYDANHNLTSVTDPMGHTNSYTYDSNGNKTSSTYPNITQGVNTTSTTAYNQYSEPTSTTDELGNVRTFNYDASYNPQSVTDTINAAPATLASFIFNANGTLQAGAIGYDISAQPTAASQFTYDANGNMAGRTDALGRFTSYTYDSLGNKLTTTLPLPNSNSSAAATTTTYTYDAFGHLTQTAAPLGRTTGSTYDANGNKTSDTDARGNVTSYQYDALNRLTITTYPTNTVTTSTKSYDFRNNLIDETDQAGNITHHVYDLSGRQTSITRESKDKSVTSTTSFTYYDDGRKYTETDALNHTTTYIYDAAGRLTSIAGPKGNFTYAYDAAGNRISSADGNGNATSFQYDSRKRLVKTVYPDKTSTTNSYDGPGNLIGVTDQAGNTVNYTYDAANQLHSVIQTNSPNTANTTSYGYDPLGNLASLTDANSHSTQNVFDVFSDITGKTLPDGSLQESRTYDAAGILTQLTHFSGKTTTFVYDVLNRLTARIPDPSLSEPTVTFTYTPTNKRATMLDGSGQTTYTYDTLDRLTTKVTPEGSLFYGYDGVGNLASISSNHGNGILVSLTYDSLNRLSTVVDNRLPSGVNTTTYAYDPANNVVTETTRNGLQTTFSYDSLNRTTGMNSSVSSYSYQLGATGNRTGATESNGRTLTWNYDGIYRLTNETIDNDQSGNNGTASYGLDPVGNRLSLTSTLTGLEAGSFGYNTDDEMSSETYDANGNALTMSGKSFVYDSENHLTSMNSGQVQLIYDGDGNRVAKIVGGVTTQYLVDDLNPTGLPQVVEEVVNGAVTRQYTYGLQRISENQIIANLWTPSFYEYDGGGSVRQLTNSAGQVTDKYEYDAFGHSFTLSGTTPNNYLYRGEQFDSDLGLYYLRARYYNPATGRFTSRDPYEPKIQGPDRTPIDPRELHKYLYTGGDPINWIDPRGRSIGESADLDLKSEDLTEDATYRLKTLTRYQIQQAQGLEEGEGAEDAVSGNNINTTGTQQEVKQLLKDIMDEWNSK